jgi:hypothetical protein
MRISDLHDYKCCYPDNIDQRHGFPSVSFIHRTVQEFLLSPSHGRIILMSAEGSGVPYCPEDRLLRAELLRLKTTDWASVVPNYPPLVISQFSGFLEAAIIRCFILARRFEYVARRPATRALAELDKVMLHLQQTLLLPTLPPPRH